MPQNFRKTDVLVPVLWCRNSGAGTSKTEVLVLSDPGVLSSHEFGYIERWYKVGCAFAMVVVSILLHAEFGRNGHWEDVPHFIFDILGRFQIKIMVLALSRCR